MPTKRTKRTLTITPPTPMLKTQLKNHVAIVLDRSSSMSGLRYDVVKAVNAILESIKTAAAQFGQETTVSLYTFGSDVTREFFQQPIEKIKQLTDSDYRPYGNTALFDAVGMAIEDFERCTDAANPDASFVVVVATDGEENNSLRYREGGNAHYYSRYGQQLPSLVEKMADVQKTDRYTITFQLPPHAGRSFSLRYGIPLGNVREWEATVQGVKEVAHSTSLAFTNYYTARSTGKKSVDSFYVQTDLSTLKKSDLKKLTDVQGRFKAWTVDKETDVKSFVESHGKKFVIGSVYYALTKKEKVQPQKAVLIQEKGSKAVYGGQEARDLIGLPAGVNANVEPGNHANYDIYVQSTSVNRKLVRGTKVMFDTSLSVDLPPTWDHLSAQAAADAKKARSTT